MGDRYVLCGSATLIVARDDSGGLDFDARGNFGIRKDREIGKGALEEAPESQAQLRRAEHEGLVTDGKHLLNVFGKGIDDVLGEARFEHESDFAGRLANAVGELLLEFRIERYGADAASFGLKRLRDRRAERTTGVF